MKQSSSVANSKKQSNPISPKASLSQGRTQIKSSQQFSNSSHRDATPTNQGVGLSKQNSGNQAFPNQKSQGSSSVTSSLNSLNSQQQQSTTNTKMFQPILRNKDQPSTVNQLKKQGSGGSATKTNNNNKNNGSINSQAQVFNYQEKHQQQQINDLPQETYVQQDQDDNYVMPGPTGGGGGAAVGEQDSYLYEQRIRPSDEVEYFDESSNPTHGNKLNFKQISLNQKNNSSAASSGNRGTLTSFNVVNESQKSDFSRENSSSSPNVQRPIQLVFDHDDLQNEQFVVIKEEIKEGDIDEDEHQFYGQKGFVPANRQHNSDFKRFDDHQFDEQQQYTKGFMVVDTPQEVREKTRNDKSSGKFMVQQENSLKSSNQFLSNNKTNQSQQPQTFQSSHDDPLFFKNQQDQQNMEKHQAHILSFSDQNQPYHVEYPPLQQKDQQLNLNNDSMNDNRQASPTTLMQQRRLQDILRSSHTENSSLNGSLIQENGKIDEKALNNMIDLEKNYVIMQYENILQQLNLEFHKLLQKAKETDEQLISKETMIKTQARIIQDKDEQQFQQDQINRQLTIQVQELLQELENATTMRQKQQLDSNIENQWQYEKDYLEQKLQSVSQKINFIEQSEIDLKDQLDVANQKLRQVEAKLRQKEEDCFQLTREAQSYQRDAHNIKELEFQLRQELQANNLQRVGLENEIQELKQQISQNQIQMRQRDQEIDNIIRENRNLKGTIEIQQQGQNEMVVELNRLKEELASEERIKLQMRSHIEKIERDTRNLQQELKRHQTSAESDRQRIAKMEDHYKAEIQKLMSHQRSQSAHQSQWENQPNRSRDDRRVSFTEDSAYKSVGENLNNTMTKFKDNNELQKPFQETHNTYYSPQRNQRTQPFSQQYSPKADANKNDKNTIAWPFMWGQQNKQQQIPPQNTQRKQTVDYDKYKQNVPSQGQGQYTTDESQPSAQRRKTIQNQNESQLHSVFQWDQNVNNNKSQLQGARSIERGQLQGSQSQKQINAYNQAQYNPNGSQQSTNRNQQNYHNNEQYPNQQWQNKPQGNYFKGPNSSGYQDQDLMPAGKKSTVLQAHQSPLQNRNKNVEQQISHLQNTLSTMQIDKERIENEYRKLGHPKNKQQIEKKQEMDLMNVFDNSFVNNNSMIFPYNQSLNKVFNQQPPLQQPNSNKISQKRKFNNKLQQSDLASNLFSQKTAPFDTDEVDDFELLHNVQIWIDENSNNKGVGFKYYDQELHQQQHSHKARQNIFDKQSNVQPMRKTMYEKSESKREHQQFNFFADEENAQQKQQNHVKSRMKSPFSIGRKSSMRQTQTSEMRQNARIHNQETKRQSYNIAETRRKLVVERNKYLRDEAIKKHVQSVNDSHNDSLFKIKDYSDQNLFNKQLIQEKDQAKSLLKNTQPLTGMNSFKNRSLKPFNSKNYYLSKRQETADAFKKLQENSIFSLEQSFHDLQLVGNQFTSKPTPLPQNYPLLNQRQSFSKNSPYYNSKQLINDHKDLLLFLKSKYQEQSKILVMQSQEQSMLPTFKDQNNPNDDYQSDQNPQLDKIRSFQRGQRPYQKVKTLDTSLNTELKKDQLGKIIKQIDQNNHPKSSDNHKHRKIVSQNNKNNKNQVPIRKQGHFRRLKPKKNQNNTSTHILLQFQQIQDNEKLEKIFKMQKEIKAKYNDISISQRQTREEPYKYIIIRGNNSELVKQCLDNRNGDWQEISSTNTIFNFKWVPFSKGIRFDYLATHGQRKMVNHFEGQDQISQKDTLFHNLQRYCEAQKQNVFDILPITFVVDLSLNSSYNELDKFYHYFHTLEKNKTDYNISKINQQILNHPLFTLIKHNNPLKYHLVESMFDGHNFWLMKPPDFNRGRGVQVFNTIDQFKKLMSDYQSGLEINLAPDKSPVRVQQTNDIPKPQQFERQSTIPAEQILKNFTNLEKVPNIVKTNQFIIQKYLEKPLLLNKRKFDIRLWVLVTQEHKCYIFKEGYIRTSSQKFELTPESIEKPFIHLTNNAVQRFNENYGIFEEGNQLSFKQAYNIMKKQGVSCDIKQIIDDQILEIIVKSLKSVEGKLNQFNRKYCMEIFGYDFILDENQKAWLIEVNTNPCLEESSSLLKILIPRMIDDALKLTIDVIFPPKKNKMEPKQREKQKLPELNQSYQSIQLASAPGIGQDSGILKIHNKDEVPSIKVEYESTTLSDKGALTQHLKHLDSFNNEEVNQAINNSKYPVDGYQDSENMWQLIYQLKM